MGSDAVGFNQLGGQGGNGYGAGGGSSGYNSAYGLGGSGADGLVVIEYSVVPEPSSVVLLGFGAISLFAVARRRKLA